MSKGFSSSPTGNRFDSSSREGSVQGSSSNTGSLNSRAEHYVNVSELTGNNRFQELLEFYSSQFGEKPNFLVRVPGRVNIIGEHVDYCGYPVLPMAIDQCIVLAVGFTKQNSLLRLQNFENNKFKDFECDLKDISIEIPQNGGPAWHNYFLCGVKGVLDELGFNLSCPFGMNVALKGNIPPSSGLSSSSALVSAAALATAYVSEMPLNRKRLASISANCERYIGTQGGGMDQAIAYLAQEGCAQFIEFHPELIATAIQLPTGACFVVANSLAEINKAATSDFNERVVECRLASRIIAKCMKLQKWRDVTRFSHLQSQLQCSLAELEQLVFKFLPNEIYTRAAICCELNVSEEEFKSEFLTPNTLHMESFKLRQRALHVVQESLRVAKFRDICEQLRAPEYILPKNGINGDSRPRSDSNRYKIGNLSESLQTLSHLMRQSHQSLKELYECSHTDLDRLVELSDSQNVGARLTGAGWGGCIVALCDSIESSAKYIRELKEKYFKQLPNHILERYQANDFNEVVFSTFPCSGAEIFLVST